MRGIESLFFIKTKTLILFAFDDNIAVPHTSEEMSLTTSTLIRKYNLENPQTDYDYLNILFISGLTECKEVERRGGRAR